MDMHSRLLLAVPEHGRNPNPTFIRIGGSPDGVLNLPGVPARNPVDSYHLRVGIRMKELAVALRSTSEYRQ